MTTPATLAASCDAAAKALPGRGSQVDLLRQHLIKAAQALRNLDGVTLDQVAWVKANLDLIKAAREARGKGVVMRNVAGAG